MISAEGTANVVGATGVGGEVGEDVTKVVSTGAKVAQDVCKAEKV